MHQWGVLHPTMTHRAFSKGAFHPQGSFFQGGRKYQLPRRTVFPNIFQRARASLDQMVQLSGLALGASPEPHQVAGAVDNSSCLGMSRAEGPGPQSQTDSFYKVGTGRITGHANRVLCCFHCSFSSFSALNPHVTWKSTFWRHFSWWARVLFCLV